MPEKRIVVISGASSGIGLRIAKDLAQAGCVVYAGARKQADIARLSAMPNITGVRLDVTHTEDMKALAAQLTTEVGYVDVLINNAGIPGWGAVMDRDMAYFRRVLDINFFGHVELTKALYPLLRKSTNRPTVINMSSQAGNYAMPFWAPYHASKWALEAFSECLRRELASTGIRVAVIQPGAIKSEAFTTQESDFEAYKNAPPTEFQAQVVTILEPAFTRPPDKARDPGVVVRDVMHAIYSKRSKLYYQPGLRLVPDLLMAKLPRRWVDAIMAKMLARAK